MKTHNALQVSLHCSAPRGSRHCTAQANCKSKLHCSLICTDLVSSTEVHWPVYASVKTTWLTVTLTLTATLTTWLANHLTNKSLHSCHQHQQCGKLNLFSYNNKKDSALKYSRYYIAPKCSRLHWSDRARDSVPGEKVQTCIPLNISLNISEKVQNCIPLNISLNKMPIPALPFASVHNRVVIYIGIGESCQCE